MAAIPSELPDGFQPGEIIEAIVVAYETMTMERFTVYKLEITTVKGKFIVFRRFV